MTRREVVIKAITMGRPGRIPINSEMNPEFVHVSDCLAVRYKELAKDEWGWTFEKLEEDKTIGQVKKHPIADWGEYKAWKIPRPDIERRFEGLAEKVSVMRAKGYFVMGLVSQYIFERLHYLRGMTNIFEDLYENGERLKELGDRIVEFQKEIIAAYAGVGVDGIWGGDDWGMQNQLMIPPTKWRQFFKPWYAEMFGTAHKHGIFTYMHSCGYNREIMGDLIEAGLDVIELHQPALMGIDWLSENCGGKLCFCCSVDIQQVLPKGNKSEIEAQVKELIDRLGKFGGGLMFNFYPDREAIGVTRAAMEHMLEAVKKYGGSDE